MNKKYDKYFDDLLNELYADCLSEIDFYPPTDNRTFNSYVEDIYGGDNFDDYCGYIFNLLEDEEYYDWCRDL